MTNSYSWTSDPMVNDMADLNPSIVNEDIMYLKKETENLYVYGEPYSINSAARNASGNANFISKVNNNEISFTGINFDNGTSCGGSWLAGIAINGNIVYALDCSTNKVYKSIDGGFTWDSGTLFGGTLQITHTAGIAVSGNNVYIAVTDKVYKSIDGGTTWDSGTLFGGTFGGRGAYITASGNNIYISGGWETFCYKSIDNGLTWLRMADFEYQITSISAVGNIVYATSFVFNKLYKSLDGGSNWTTITSPNYGVTLDCVSAVGDTVYVISAGKLYKSLDGGNTWDSGMVCSGTLVAADVNNIYIGNTTAAKIYKLLKNIATISVTFPDNTKANYDNLLNIKTLITDGTWNILIEKGSANAIATKSIVYEQAVEPTSWVNGDYWVDISAKPYVPYKKVNGTKSIVQFVRLGNVVRTGSILSNPVSFELNRSLKYVTSGYSSAFWNNAGVSFAMAVASTFYPISNANITEVISDGFTWSNGGATCTRAGKYAISHGVSLRCATANQALGTVIFKNGAVTAGTTVGTMYTASTYIDLVGFKILSLAVGDTIQVGIANLSAANPVFVDTLNLVIQRIAA